MKRVMFIVFSTVILFSLCISAYAERKWSVEIPAGAVIPSKASVTITKYEKTIPTYGDCAGGEASYVMALSALGIDIAQDDIHKASGLKKVRGCASTELYHASINLGIDVESHIIWDLKSKKERLSHINGIKYFISQGYPVVISWDENPKKFIDDFCAFALVVAYDDEKKEITIVDPYTGDMSGRVFSYKEFINHWQWDNSDGSYSYILEAIKGKFKDPESRLKTLTFHIKEGETVELKYNEIIKSVVFFVVEMKENELVTQMELLGQDRSKLNDWIINDGDSPNFWVSGGGVFYFRFTSLKGEGDISITYEHKDGDLTLKK